MNRILKSFIACTAVFICQICAAQKFSLSTDLLGYAKLGTMNVEASYAVSRHWNIVAGARYNPFTFNKGNPDKQFQHRQLSCSVGARLWPWHVWSGWWFAGKLRYQEYNTGGILSPATEEGDRFGAGLYCGYTLMLTRHLNMEFGLGFWGGTVLYRKYSCPVCGPIIQSGNRMFLLPDDFVISLAYVF